ncbi:DUF2934 domain-containing protein [Variovorax sp. H27-G14]|uniref:DUF2934 domain-containing protein n=1 Tax=Variovorax sp. H27-G14 TaxID=3111914 RepID=UPI0038FC275C
MKSTLPSGSGGETLPTTSDVPSDPPRPDVPAGEPVSRDEAIRRAAYAAYERRGGQSGDETQDWLEAEAEVDRQHQGNE